MAGVWNTDLWVGTRWYRSLSWTAAGVAVPMVDYTAVLKVRDANEVVLLTLNTEADIVTPPFTEGLITLDPADGTIELDAPADLTADLLGAPGTHHFDLRLITASGVELEPLVAGVIRFHRTASR